MAATGERGRRRPVTKPAAHPSSGPPKGPAAIGRLRAAPSVSSATPRSATTRAAAGPLRRARRRFGQRQLIGDDGRRVRTRASDPRRPQGARPGIASRASAMACGTAAFRPAIVCPRPAPTRRDPPTVEHPIVPSCVGRASGDRTRGPSAAGPGFSPWRRRGDRRRRRREWRRATVEHPRPDRAPSAFLRRPHSVEMGQAPPRSGRSPGRGLHQVDVAARGRHGRRRGSAPPACARPPPMPVPPAPTHRPIGAGPVWSPTAVPRLPRRPPDPPAHRGPRGGRGDERPAQPSRAHSANVSGRPARRPRPPRGRTDRAARRRRQAKCPGRGPEDGRPPRPAGARPGSWERVTTHHRPATGPRQRGCATSAGRGGGAGPRPPHPPRCPPDRGPR